MEETNNRFCNYCGTELQNGTKFCPNCGKPVENIVEEVKQENRKTSGFAIAGFVLALSSLLIDFFGLNSLLGIILSAVGLGKTKSNNEKGKGFAIIGLIISIPEFIAKIIQIYNLFDLI